MTNAQLYWDDQDPKNEGWWLRYIDDGGVEQSYDVNETKCATTHELAAAVEAAIGARSTLTGTIKVLRGDILRGTIRLLSGMATDWRAL